MLRKMLFLALVAVPQSGFAWRAENYHVVNPVSDAIYEVIGRGGSAGPDYWCAAGEYAHRVLGAASNARIYIVRERGASVTSVRKSAVHFSLVPPEDAPEAVGPLRAITLRLDRTGDSLNVAQGRNYCYYQKNLEF